MSWTPNLPFGEGPRYLQIVAALENDITSGAVTPGQRLPTHREMAALLDISVGTISKAYAAAERRGLIMGEVGRGTFVLPISPELGVTDTSVTQAPRRANLALNAPPQTGADTVLAEAVSEVVSDDALTSLLSYLPHQGLYEHRAAMAGWLREHGVMAEPDRLFITHGAQHAIAIATLVLARPGATVLVENLTYSGIIALSQMQGYALRGVPMDRHGLVPEHLDRAFSETKAKVLYATPTLQTATASVMPVERRREVAEVLRRHDAWLIEDDAYGFLCDTPFPTLASYIPERSFHVVTFAKCLVPGLRIGAMSAPPEFRDRIVGAIRSTGWMANAVMAAAVVRMIDNGALDDQVLRKRAAAAERLAIAYEILGSQIASQREIPAFHTWMKVPPGRTASELMSRAAQAGITIVPPSPMQAMDPMGPGFRLCLGGVERPAELRKALETLTTILEETETMSIV